MTAKEVKTEIQKVLDKFPDTSLGAILDYLKTLQSKSADAAHLKQILSEDKELLIKLSE